MSDPDTPLPPGPIRSARRPSSAFRSETSGLRLRAGLGLLLVGVVARRRGAARVAVDADRRCRDRRGARGRGGGRGPSHPGDLFYVADNGQELVPVSRQVLYGATPLEQARRIVEAWSSRAPEGQRSAIPDGTTVRSVFLAADGNAFVDLGGADRDRTFRRLAQRGA